MAQVLMNRLGRDRFEAFSAGSKPAGYIHPLAIKTLQGAKLPVEGLRSKSWEEFQGQSFDFVITVCDRAKESCPVWPGQPVTAHWGFEDPAEAAGTDEQKQRTFRRVFTEIQARINLFLELEKQVRNIGQSAVEQQR